MSAPVPRELRRYLRQMRVVGVGLEGQERLGRARVALASAEGTRAAAVERDYLCRAGVSVDDAARPRGAAEVPLRLESEVAQSALAGAYRALQAVRALLAPESP